MVAILATLDTKHAEAAYLRAALERLGRPCLLVDIGFGGAPAGTVEPDIGAEVVAAAVGADLSDLRRGETAAAIAVMGEAVAALLSDRVAARRVATVLGVGGSKGTAIAAHAMARLPETVEKVVVSAAAPTYAAAALEGLDAVLIPSTADFNGLNALTRTVLDRAARVADAVTEGASSMSPARRPLIGMSALGVTSRAATEIQLLFAEQEIAVFPALGAGLRRIRQMAHAEHLAGLVHITPQDLVLADLQGDATLDPWPDLPMVVAPGSVDMQLATAPPPEPATCYQHAPGVVLVRTTPDENRRMGERLGERLMSLTAPWRLVYPALGFSQHDRPGGPFEDPVADAAFLDGFRRSAADDRWIRIDAHINDPAFAAAVAEECRRLFDTHQEDN